MDPAAEPEQNVLIIGLDEPLDREALEAHRAEIESGIARGCDRVVVSLGALDYINSAALGFLIRMRKRLKAAGGRLVLSEPGVFVAKALKVLDLEELFHVFETDEAALRALQC